MLKSVPRKPAHTRFRDNRCILLSYCIVSARQYRRYDISLPLISLLAIVRFKN